VRDGGINDQRARTGKTLNTRIFGEGSFGFRSLLGAEEVLFEIVRLLRVYVFDDY